VKCVSELLTVRAKKGRGVTTKKSGAVGRGKQASVQKSRTETLGEPNLQPVGTKKNRICDRWLSSATALGEDERTASRLGPERSKGVGSSIKKTVDHPFVNAEFAGGS